MPTLREYKILVAMTLNPGITNPISAEIPTWAQDDDEARRQADAIASFARAGIANQIVVKTLSDRAEAPIAIITRS